MLTVYEKVVFSQDGKRAVRHQWREMNRSPLDCLYRQDWYEHLWAWFWFWMDHPRVSQELAEFLGPMLGTFWAAPRGDT